MNGDYALEDTVYLPFTTRAFATGIPTALVSGEVQIYEDASVTQITAAETLTVSLDTIAGFNMCSVAATAANGFEATKSYTAILSAGTVDSVSVIGEVVGQFTIQASAAAVDLANATDGLGAIKAETAAILDDTGTSGVVLGADSITAAKIADNAITSDHLDATAITEIWAKVVESEGSRTAQQVMSILLAAMAGVTADAGATLKTPEVAGSTRIVATINGSNERTAITLTPSS